MRVKFFDRRAADRMQWVEFPMGTPHIDSGGLKLLEQIAAAPGLERLAQQLNQFDFVPGVSTAGEYGRYMIRDSAHFEYDENLADFYDYEKYGRQRMENEHSAFNHRGYVSYHGVVSMEELLAGVPCQRMDFSIGDMEMQG